MLQQDGVGGLVRDHIMGPPGPGHVLLTGALPHELLALCPAEGFQGRMTMLTCISTSCWMCGSRRVRQIQWFRFLAMAPWCP